MFGDKGLQEETYTDIEKKKEVFFSATDVWLGITDKYWATTLLPDTNAQVAAKFSTGTIGNNIKTYQSDYLGPAQTIAPGGAAAVNGRLFAGAKEVEVVDNYDKQLKLNRFELLIDWGWFYFITKPLFLAMDWIYRHVGNFGVAILIVTVIIKIFFFPLANKSYASMAKMKAVQPEMMTIRERFADDKMKQQQAMMELYKKEKINPIAGCLPVRSHSLGSFARSAAGPLPLARHLAADHGRDHVVPDEAQPAAARPDPGDDLQLHADHLHLHAGELPGRTGDLLGLEQHALGRPAERDHAQARGQDRAVR